MLSKINKKSSVSFDVLYGLGQELHAPLQSLVKSTSTLIAQNKAKDFEYITYKDFKKTMATLEQMNRQLERCAQTTERMIQLHQIKNKAATDNCKINDVVADVLDLLSQQLKNAKITVTPKLVKYLPKAAISNVALQQVVYNILLNAIQAMPAGGKIRIRTGWNGAKATVGLVIEDEGVGIPPEYLTKVFEPFFTTKERGIEKNSGLGLSIVHSIVTAAHGSIAIQSSLRQGTVVTIDIPVSLK